MTERITPLNVDDLVSEYGCKCPEKDYRNVMMTIADECKRLQNDLRDANESNSLLRSALQQADANALIAMGDSKQITALDDALAVSAEMLLTYKDYYGTSVAQVKHLQECERMCSMHYVPPVPSCPNYPSE